MFDVENLYLGPTPHIAAVRFRAKLEGKQFLDFHQGKPKRLGLPNEAQTGNNVRLIVPIAGFCPGRFFDQPFPLIKPYGFNGVPELRAICPIVMVFIALTPMLQIINPEPYSRVKAKFFCL